MVKGARSLDRQMGRAVALARIAFVAPLISAFLISKSASAQFGPVQHDGFLEYQFRINRSEGTPDYTTNLASWRAHASTWVWRPYILQLDGSPGWVRFTSAVCRSCARFCAG